jgi:hypothetical protein
MKTDFCIIRYIGIWQLVVLVLVVGVEVENFD